MLLITFLCRFCSIPYGQRAWWGPYRCKYSWNNATAAKCKFWWISDCFYFQWVFKLQKLLIFYQKLFWRSSYSTYRPKTQYGYNSTLKMEDVSKITIFGQKMTVKSGLKSIFEILHAKKPSWKLNFRRIFAIPSPSRHCQIMQKLFVVFFHSLNLL